MSTDYRALCAELVALLDCFGSTFNIPIEAPVVTRARAALAEQPVAPPMPVPGDAEGLAEVFWNRYDQPKPVAPTDEEIMELMPQQFRDDLATVSRLAAHGTSPDVTPGIFRVSLNTGALDYARAVFARWGQP